MSSTNNPSLGEKLLRLRKEMKMTQDDVAKVLGMSRTSFSKYENGTAASGAEEDCGYLQCRP